MPVPDNIDGEGGKKRRHELYRSKIPKLQILEGRLSKITEAEFREYAKSNVVRRAAVMKTQEGFVLVIELTWKEGLHTLYTQRNRPRAWASLDRMLEYLDRHELQLKSIELQLE